MADIDRLLDLRPDLRRRRQLSAGVLRRLLSRERGCCTWCNKPCIPPRHSWCSGDCVTEFYLRCSPSHQARAVRKRDRNCQLCGLDVEAAYREFLEEWRRSDVYRQGYLVNRSTWSKAKEEIASKYGYGRGTFSEVDHIVPVVEGGGLCTLDNLRLLCGKCHAEATRSLSGRLRSKGGN